MEKPSKSGLIEITPLGKMYVNQILITLAWIGAIDMIVQLLTDKKIRIIHSVLSMIFGD